MKKKTVFVGLSGGVDSSVSALRLVRQGYDVVGVFIEVWQPDFIVCDAEKDRLDAMRVAAKLEIPFMTFDAREAYKRNVADYMIAEYQAGRTPNPDVMCNEYVKFGVFYDFARSHGADYVATGHYAQVAKTGDTHTLVRGVDTNKDQSYFLWRVKKDQLPHILFPIGDTNKSEVRQEAEQAGLITHNKADSQGICFLGQVDMKEFLSHFIKTEQGAVLDEEGTVIGTHDGALLYTIGQRHGFTTSVASDANVPRYVVAKDLVHNTVTVSTEPPRTVNAVGVMLRDLNLLYDCNNEPLTAQFRYRQKPFSVTLRVLNNGCGMLTVLDSNVDAPTPGQSCVLYRHDTCVGGGIIE